MLILESVLKAGGDSILYELGGIISGRGSTEVTWVSQDGIDSTEGNCRAIDAKAGRVTDSDIAPADRCFIHYVSNPMNRDDEKLTVG